MPDTTLGMINTNTMTEFFRRLDQRERIVGRGEIRKGVKILAKHKKEPVLIRTDSILISTFHPELTEDTRVHEYFVDMVKKNQNAHK